ncbi:MAG: hypothetical protein M1834_008208 [Cirrosporium novae-zelandiae]|nr:MAG: hypothetical protein M1834_008208 [Cirrosporium novae-zelandiae]
MASADSNIDASVWLDPTSIGEGLSTESHNSPPTSNDSSDNPKRHAACDECRTRKLKCSGESSGCSRCIRQGIKCDYSIQKQLGRPKKRKLRHSSEDISTDPTAGDSGVSVTGQADFFELLNGDALTGNEQSYNTTQDASTEIDFNWGMLDLPSNISSSNNTQTVQPLMPNFSDDTELSVANNHLDNGCSCLTDLYLSLSTLQSIKHPTFPSSLYGYRSASSTAANVLRCPQCPQNPMTRLQNVMLLGTLLPLIVYGYQQLLASIDREASSENPRSFRIGDSTPAHQHLHTGTPDCPLGLNIDLDPDDWRLLARKTIKKDILGNGNEDTQNGLLNLINEMEQRQRRWHSEKPACMKKFWEANPQCDPALNPALDPALSSGQAKEGSLCLQIVANAKAMLQQLDVVHGQVGLRAS